MEKFLEAAKDAKNTKGCGRDAGGKREGIYKNEEKTASWAGKDLEGMFST